VGSSAEALVEASVALWVVPLAEQLTEKLAPALARP
jgi:hypothetical protein